MEIVDHNADAERADNFRPDYRLPESFRADLEDYHRSGYDRGHLAASANHRDNDLQNSETFLLSNMSPQHADLNRRIWRDDGPVAGTSQMPSCLLPARREPGAGESAQQGHDGVTEAAQTVRTSRGTPEVSRQRETDDKRPL